jgi:hypothetical protein
LSTRRRWRKCNIQVLALLACSFLSGGALGAETLRQAVSAAIERFPEIRTAQFRREAARAQVGQARAEFFPSLSGSLVKAVRRAATFRPAPWAKT